MVKAMEALKAAGAVPKWGRLEGELQRRTVFLRQLTEARPLQSGGGLGNAMGNHALCDAGNGMRCAAGLHRCCSNPVCSGKPVIHWPGLLS